MKKFLLIAFTALFSSGLFAQSECSDIFISEYVEAYSNNKALEIYNPTPNPVDLTDMYRLIRWSNGSEVADTDPRYVLPLEGSIPAYGVIVIIQDTLFPGQDTMIDASLKSKANYLGPADYDAGTDGCRVVFWNGDDAISIQKNFDGTWEDIDIFGDIGVRPVNWQGGTSPVGAWTDTPPYADGQGNYLTKDQTLKRKYSVTTGITRAEMDQYGPDSFYALAEYDSLPNQTYDSLGFHKCSCKSLSVNELEAQLYLEVYPNPVRYGKVQLQAAEKIERISLMNIYGEEVDLALPSSDRWEYRLPDGLARGVYLLKVYTGSQKTAIKKILVQ